MNDAPAVKPPPTAVEIQARIVNGLLVVFVIVTVGVVYALHPDKSDNFGVFTTLVGTALSAYFGISATREVSRNAVDNANTQAGDAREQAGQLKAKHDQQSAKIAAAQNAGSLDEARAILAT